MKVEAAYTRLLVTDMEACFFFYENIMEFEVNIDAREDGYAEFEAGDLTLSLFRREEMAQIIQSTDKPKQAECQDKVALVFSVRNVDAEYEKLIKKGVKFVTVPTVNASYGLKTAYLRDPDGTLIGLYQLIV